MSRKSKDLSVAHASGLLSFIPGACLGLAWHSVTFQGASSPGEYSAITHLFNWLMFGVVIFALSSLLGYGLGYVFGLLIDLLNHYLFSNPQNTKLQYRWVLLLWAFIYSLVLSLILLFLGMVSLYQIPLTVLLSFCYWAVIAQMMALEYLENRS